MAIPTSRTKDSATLQIDNSRCTGCGVCVEVCKDFGLALREGKVTKADHSIFGCVGCGHCMAVCPQQAIQIQGRCLTPDDLIELPEPTETATYEELLYLMQRRRSVREFKDNPVEREVIDKVLQAAQTAPMGLPPSDVHVLVLDNRNKVRQFAEDFCAYLGTMKWVVSSTFLTLMRPFWGKANHELFRDFVRPCFKIFIDSMKKGINVVNYDAPVMLYFYGSPFADPADPLIAATYAMLAAESLGLGTCMLGAVHPLIQYGKGAARFRKKYGIRFKSREGVIVIMGYSRVQYQKGIRRTFASIDFQ